MSWLSMLRIVNSEKRNPFQHFRSVWPSTLSTLRAFLCVGGGDWLSGNLPLNKGQDGQVPNLTAVVGLGDYR